MRKKDQYIYRTGWSISIPGSLCRMDTVKNRQLTNSDTLVKSLSDNIEMVMSSGMLETWRSISVSTSVVLFLLPGSRR